MKNAASAGKKLSCFITFGYEPTNQFPSLDIKVVHYFFKNISVLNVTILDKSKILFYIWQNVCSTPITNSFI